MAPSSSSSDNDGLPREAVSYTDILQVRARSFPRPLQGELGNQGSRILARVVHLLAGDIAP